VGRGGEPSMPLDVLKYSKLKQFKKITRKYKKILIPNIIIFTKIYSSILNKKRAFDSLCLI
jgi:hypothetical protein